MYQTLAEAEQAAQGYEAGTTEADGFQYDGAAVYDQQAKQYLRIYGDFPDEKAQAQVAATQSPMVEEPIAAEVQPVITETPYRVGDILYLDNQPFVVESVGIFDVHMRDPNTVYPIMRAESKERLSQLLALDKRNAAYLPKDGAAVEPVPVPQIIPENYRITDDHLGEGGPKEKFKRNIEAIRVLKALEADNRPASPAEQEILAQYVGWGGMTDAFDERKPAWASENAQIRNLLTKEEYESAMGSVPAYLDCAQ